MKKTIARIALCLLLISTLGGCCIKHEWQPATCTTPETCVNCNKTRGEALGHSWEEATCSTPRKCSVCGITEGDALGHDYIYDDVADDFVCSRCKEKKVFKNGELDEMANMMISDYSRFKDLYEDKYIIAQIFVDPVYTDDPSKEVVVDLYHVEDGSCLAYFVPSDDQKGAFSTVLDNYNLNLTVRGKLTGGYYLFADGYIMRFSNTEIISYGWEG